MFVTPNYIYPVRQNRYQRLLMLMNQAIADRQPDKVMQATHLINMLSKMSANRLDKRNEMLNNFRTKSL